MVDLWGFMVDLTTCLLLLRTSSLEGKFNPHLAPALAR
jgi:hypothetical protein